VIVNANSTSHADLFAALKGGQNNFGVVTNFQLRVFPQPPLWGGVIVYSNTTDKELIDALVAFKNPARFDPYAMFTFGFAYDVTHRAFTANIAMYHSRPSMVNGSALESFTNVQPQLYNSIRMGSPGSFAGEKFTPVVKQY
jgi:FAD/FMN-containing dehydrogenase